MSTINNRAAKHKKQKLTEMNKYIIIVGNLKTSLLVIDRITETKLNQFKTRKGYKRFEVHHQPIQLNGHS